ncbi:MAG: SUMF1/EgtB/PvdO family nonheme iron enzyme [Alloprevotella sp.]
MSGSNRVNRGGSWNNSPRNCRSSNRNNNTPDNSNNNLGLRLVLSQLRTSMWVDAHKQKVVNRLSSGMLRHSKPMTLS